MNPNDLLNLEILIQKYFYLKIIELHKNLLL